MQLSRSIKRLFTPTKAVVLMYHRIADTATDPWQLSVTMQNFESHLGLLSSSYRVISTSELVNELEHQQLQKNRVCITFDDGYQDNYLHALPLLEKFSCPATFFIATGSIGSGEPFWWDILADVFLTRQNLPENLELRFNDQHFRFQLENNGSLTEGDRNLHKVWRWPAEPPTQRSRIYLELWMSLRDLPASTIKEAIAKLKEWSGLEPENIDGNFPMSKAELIEMSHNKYVETGVHTVTHAALAALPGPSQKAEVTGSKDYLDEVLGKQPRLIAYPYGNYSQVTLDVARNSGLKAAFTTDPKAVSIKSDLFQLGRFQVINENREELEKQLNTWFNN